MPFRFYFFLLFFTFLLFFYPGDNIFTRIIAYNREIFREDTVTPAIKIQPIPTTKTPPPAEVTAEGIYIVELESFTPLYEKNSHAQFFPASTTKVITALVAADLYDPNKVITVQVGTTEGQIMELVSGEKMTAENLLYGTLVHSGNDAAYALAFEHGYDEFIQLMNDKA